MARPVHIHLHSDESGSFQSRERREPFVLSAVAHQDDHLSDSAVRELWDRLDLPDLDSFHAVDVPKSERKQLNRAAELAVKVLGHLDKVRAVGVYYRNHPDRWADSAPQSVYVDLVAHLAVSATRAIVRDLVRGRPTGQQDDELGVTLHLHLAQRFGVNNKVLQDVLTTRLRRDLYASRLAHHKAQRRDLGMVRARPVCTDYLHVLVGNVPVQDSPRLVLSDLLSNAVYRDLGGKGAFARSFCSQVIHSELLGLLSDQERLAIHADMQTLAALSTPAAPTQVSSWRKRLDEALREAPSRWSARAMERSVLVPPLSSAERVTAITELLERGELWLETQRDHERADAAAKVVGDALRSHSWTEGFEPIDRDATEQALDSLRLASSNYRGRPLPDWFDADAVSQRTQRILAAQRERDALLHLHNRASIALQNAYRFGEASDRCRPLISMLVEEMERTTEAFGQPPAPSWTFGALCGSAGLAMSMDGALRADTEVLDEAAQAFATARTHFTTPEDLKRQWVYQGHLGLEYLRLSDDGSLPDVWNDALDVVADEIAEDIDAWLASPHSADAWRQSFALHLRLKEALLTGDLPPWAQRAAEILARAPATRPLPHPTEQIVGLLLLLLPDAPRELEQQLTRTARQDRSLIGLIADLYLLALRVQRGVSTDAEAVLVRVPDSVREGWAGYGLDERLRAAVGGEGEVLGVLPLNYW